MKRVIRAVLLSIVFIGLCVCVYSYTAYIFRDKSILDMQDNFTALERDSVDVIFVGNSHQYCTINPDILAEEYGIESFMMAISMQTIPMSYYAIMEAIEYQHPGTIVLEAGYCANSLFVLEPHMMHAFIDGMPFSDVKFKAIHDLIEPEDRVFHYFDIGYYHDRWKVLQKKDFEPERLSPRGTLSYDVTEVIPEITVVDRSQKEVMLPEIKEYLDKIILLCKEQGVELIVYIAPYNAKNEEPESLQTFYYEQRVFNWLEDYFGEQQITYYNLFHELDEIGVDYSKDFMDYHHFNATGQDKLTRFMVEKGYVR